MLPADSGPGLDVAISAAGEAVVASSNGALGYFAAATGKLLQWAKPLDTTGKVLHGIAAYGDGVVASGYIKVGSASGGQAGYLVRYGKDRKVMWEKTYDAGGADYLTEVRALSDGRIAAAGAVSVAGKGWDVRALLLGSDGAVFSSTTLGSTGNEYPTALAVLKDSRLVVVGHRGDGVNSDGYHATVTPWGHAQCVTAGYCADLTVAGCDDKNPCTVDSCAPGKGCTHAAITGCK